MDSKIVNESRGGAVSFRDLGRVGLVKVSRRLSAWVGSSRGHDKETEKSDGGMSECFEPA